MVNLYLALHPANSLNSYKSYLSILSLFFVSSWIISKVWKRKGHVPTCSIEFFKLSGRFTGNTELSLISWQYTIKQWIDKSNRKDNITSIQHLDLSWIKSLKTARKDQGCCGPSINVHISAHLCAHQSVHIKATRSVILKSCSLLHSTAWEPDYWH